MLRVFRRERDRAVKVPESLVRALAEAQSHGLDAWRTARAERRLRRIWPGPGAAAGAAARAGRRHRPRRGALRRAARPLRAGDDRGPAASRCWTASAQSLVPLVDALDGAVDGPDPFTGRTFDSDRQWRFTMELLPLLGFDLEAGRQDRSIHPFTGGTHPTDVRLTTRIDPSNPSPAVFGTLHECGHGLYEQGFSPEHYRTPLAAAPSMGLHESQSRLWENLVGRSLPFWRFLYPAAAGGIPRGARAGAAGRLPPGDQPRPALADPRRGRRGDLQPAHRAPHQRWSWR